MATAPLQFPPDEFIRVAKTIEDEIGKVIVGQDQVVRGILTCVISGGHALLEGVPGLGKTMLIRTLSDVLDLSFSRIQFTPDLMPADITGTNVIAEDGGMRGFQFQPGRDQSRHPEDPVRAARSDAGAPRDGCQDELSA
jgi:MoxR-like ATPase